jgi:hypothetical protein
MARDERHAKESAPVDFQEPVTLAWDARDAYDDPERAAWAWKLVCRTLGIDEERFRSPGVLAPAGPNER